MSGEYKDSGLYETLKVGVRNIMKCMSNFESPEWFSILNFPNAYKVMSDIYIYFSVKCSFQLYTAFDLQGRKQMFCHVLICIY